MSFLHPKCAVCPCMTEFLWGCNGMCNPEIQKRILYLKNPHYIEEKEDKPYWMKSTEEQWLGK